MSEYIPRTPDEQGLTVEQKRELKKIAHKAASDLSSQQLYYLASQMLSMAMDLDPAMEYGPDIDGGEGP